MWKLKFIIICLIINGINNSKYIYINSIVRNNTILL